MTPTPISPEQRSAADTLSGRLLGFHKVLLDWERANYEAGSGRISSPNEFLGLVLEHAQFAWLRELSGLIVALDEALARRSKAGAEELEMLLAKTRELMQAEPEGAAFQRRLAEAVAGSPEAARMYRELGIAGT
jgi:hypothetical protein